jgi:hypothetical protein
LLTKLTDKQIMGPAKTLGKADYCERIWTRGIHLLKEEHTTLELEDDLPTDRDALHNGSPPQLAPSDPWYDQHAKLLALGQQA